jgi:glycosyltransferase involved in cell wall biosynthesis
MSQPSLDGRVPKVSVIIPVFDCETYLAEAVESVLAQTWQDWELLLVDDGSTDRSSVIAHGYAVRHPGRIAYLDHPGHANRGKSVSRNLGAARARGSYFAFLDADDVFLPEKLERQVALLDSRPAIDLVFGDTLYWYSWTGEPADAPRDKPRGLGIGAGSEFAPSEISRDLVRRRRFTPATCSTLIRRSAFERVGGYEDDFPDLYEDQVLYYKVFLRCRTYMAPGIYDRYRQHPASSCAIAISQGRYREDGASVARHVFLDWFAGYLRREHPWAMTLRLAVTAERWRNRHPTAARQTDRLASRARRLVKVSR